MHGRAAGRAAVPADEHAGTSARPRASDVGNGREERRFRQARHHRARRGRGVSGRNRSVSGRDLIAAYVAGFEAGVRAGQGAPAHHDGGWHLTGTLGTIAAGAACAKLLGLTGQQMTYTLAIAATQAAGMQQNRGTMCKSLHAGKAAANGLLAALLASKGFDGTGRVASLPYALSLSIYYVIADHRRRLGIDIKHYSPPLPLPHTGST
jgi:hypothetical protein